MEVEVDIEGRQGEGEAPGQDRVRLKQEVPPPCSPCLRTSFCHTCHTATGCGDCRLRKHMDRATFWVPRALCAPVRHLVMWEGAPGEER